MVFLNSTSSTKEKLKETENRTMLGVSADGPPASVGRHSNNLLQIVGKMGGRIRSKADSSENREINSISGVHSHGSSSSKFSSALKTASDVPTSAIELLSGESNVKNDLDEASHKSSPYAKLALLTINNALCMGARTQVSLCPPRVRDELVKSLKHRKQKQKKSLSASRRHSVLHRVSTASSVGAKSEELINFEKWLGETKMEEYEKDEDDFLNNPRKYMSGYEEELKECCSSGDEDIIDTVLDEDEVPSGRTKGHTKHLEEYTLGVIPGTIKAGVGSEKSLPFNLRKIRWFDAITAADRAEARQYLIGERMMLKQKKVSSLVNSIDGYSGHENKVLDVSKSTISKELNNNDRGDTKFGKFPLKMTPRLAAALVLESMALNRLESLEGMSRCYGAIVTTGTALLDSESNHISSHEKHKRSDSLPDDDLSSEKKKPSRAEIKTDLSLLLTVTLEHASGEAILGLAKLRKLCATKRYQRRFVQRVAPYLVRPPGAAMWSLRHLDDMKAILVATEMILDSAFDIFSPGWSDVRTNLLAESKIKESLNSAAERIKTLSGHQPLDNMIKNSGSHKKTPVLNAGSTSLKDGPEEILIVDRQILHSISNLFSKDWILQRREKSAFLHGLQESSELKVTDASSVVTSPSHSMPRMPLSPTRVTGQLPESDVSLRSPVVSGGTNIVDSNKGIVVEFISPSSILKTVDDLPNVSVGSYSPRSPLKPVISMASLGSTNRAPESQSSSPPKVGQDSPPAVNIDVQHFTMSAADRKKIVAATRALRIQIMRFEEAFHKLYGRKPRGPRERASLLTTYAQYRDWKRAIRADAACRIQAFFRGSFARRRVRVLLTTIRPPYFPSVDESENVSEIEGGGFEVYPNAPVSFVPERFVSSETSISSYQTTREELEAFKVDKRVLKDALKEYDRDFYRKNGRMPVKAEKEPIRHLYEKYNNLKSRIKELESRFGVEKQGDASETSPTQSDHHIIQQEPTTAHVSLRSNVPSTVVTPNPVVHTTDIAFTKIAETEIEAPSVDLSALSAEKQNLHRILRNYEREFSRRHGRQVSCFEDIRPVARQYRRYKEIKKALQGSSVPANQIELDREN